MVPWSRNRTAWQWQPGALVGHEVGAPMSVEHAPRSLVSPSLQWSGFDDTGVLTNKSPQGRWISLVGEKANHVIGQGRMLWCQSLPDAESPTVTTDPIWRTFFPERNPHGTERVWIALLLPRPLPGGAATNPTFGRSPGGPFQTAGGYKSTAVASPGDLSVATLVEPVLVGGRFRELDIAVKNGFRLVGLTIYERSRTDRALNGDLDVFDPSSVRGGAPIRDRPLRKIRRGLEQSWHNLRNVTSGSVVGNATTTRIIGTTPTNIFDRTSTARTASTPGVLIDELNGSLARPSANYVEASVEVCASITAGATGQVQFVSSLGSVTITGVTTTRQVYRTLTKLSLDTDISGRGEGAATEKVDILAAAGTGGESIDVVAWAICTDPATS
jgi:hypothetical protein